MPDWIFQGCWSQNPAQKKSICQAEFPTVICTSDLIHIHPSFIPTYAPWSSTFFNPFIPSTLHQLSPQRTLRSIIFRQRFLNFWKSKSRSVEKHRQRLQGSQILAKAPAAWPRFAPLQSLERSSFQPVILQ